MTNFFEEPLIKPTELWKHFKSIAKIPRPSRKEAKIRDFILALAQEYDLKTYVDEVGNVIVYVPATKGFEQFEAIIIQNHMDMVTDATPGKVMNFDTDSLELIRKDEWLYANDTTLGADNGIGCAAALALITDLGVKHPALELLFTVDEETGLNGAWGVEAERFTGKSMLNLDTEEWGSFYIGCAGGVDYEFTSDIQMVDSSLSGEVYKIGVEGFIGGHSGINIHEQRGNALKFLMEWLYEIPQDEIELIEWRGGKAHNIIPRDSYAIVKISSPDSVQEIGQKLVKRWKSFLPKNDQSFKITMNCLNKDLDEINRDHLSVLSSKDYQRFLNFCFLFYHGAHSYYQKPLLSNSLAPNTEFDHSSDEKIVSLSNNMAVSILMRGKFYLQSSLRFFDHDECVSFENKLLTLAHTFAINAQKNGQYPSWKPSEQNQLLDFATEKYQALFNKEAKVTAIHAGLECGILKDKIGCRNVISFGPTIEGAHSPQERVHIPSVEKFWILLVHLLSDLKIEKTI